MARPPIRITSRLDSSRARGDVRGNAGGSVWALAHGLASLWLSGGAEEALSLEAWRELSRRALGRMWAGLLRGPAAPGR